jgi:hypothetical protein
MEKITSILAVVENSASGAVVLDKAVALARAFGARVDLLVADASLTSQFASRCAELVYDEVTLCSLHRSDEPLHTLLLRRIHERPPDLVVKAPGGVHPLGEWTLHANDRELAADSPVPLMLVGMNAWNNPMRLAAAVDVSAPEATIGARAVLQAAGFLVLGCHGWLDVLYSEREERDETVRMERAVKLAQLVREFHVGMERLQMFDGEPAKRLPPLITARHYDMLVLAIGPHDDVAAAVGNLAGKPCRRDRGRRGARQGWTRRARRGQARGRALSPPAGRARRPAVRLN